MCGKKDKKYCKQILAETRSRVRVWGSRNLLCCYPWQEIRGHRELPSVFSSLQKKIMPNHMTVEATGWVVQIHKAFEGLKVFGQVEEQKKEGLRHPVRQTQGRCGGKRGNPWLPLATIYMPRSGIMWGPIQAGDSCGCFRLSLSSFGALSKLDNTEGSLLVV